MIILPEGMFKDVVDPIESPFYLCGHQERDVSLVLAPRSGWYNHYGQVLSQGDLALNDFMNIMNAMQGLEDKYEDRVAPFIVVPFSNKQPSCHTISQHELAQVCTFVITSSEVISYDLLTPTLINILRNNEIRLVVGKRRGDYSILEEYLIH